MLNQTVQNFREMKVQQEEAFDTIKNTSFCLSHFKKNQRNVLFQIYKISTKNYRLIVSNDS